MHTQTNSKGQIVIPAVLRHKYGIKEGTKLIVIDNGDSITLQPVANDL